MKGQKRFLQIIPLLLASGALALAQTSGMQTPGWPSQQGAYPPQAAYNRTPPPAGQVGPGTINYIEGSVTLDGQPLTAQPSGPAALRPGATLDTAQGYAEVLLTPGAFFRVGPNSEVRMISSGLADTKTEVVHGAGILEVDQLIKGTNLSVLINGATVHVQKTGLYLYDANQHAVMVIDGKADVQEASGARTLGSHDEVLLASTNPLKKHGFDEKLVKAEPLYVWSMARSQAESQASNYAASNAAAYSVASPGWFWDPYSDFYGFWPAEAALYSPFGWGFYSPLFFGYGFYGGQFYGGHYVNGRYYLANARQYAAASRVTAGSGLHTSAFARSTASGFHGGGFGGGFHGGGFHGGGFGGGGGRR